MLIEEVGEVFEFTSVARKSCQLGKDKASDMASFNVLHHAFGLRVLHDGFAALSGKVIDFLDQPSTARCIAPGTLFVMFRTIPVCLVFGRNTNPDSDWFFQVTIVLHSTTSYPK